MQSTWLSILKYLTLAQWGWLWSAYWRLWVVQVRIKWGKSGWWLTKVQFADSGASENLLNDKTGSNDNLNGNCSNSNHSEKESDHLFELVRLAARMHLWQTACLPKSIVLADMLNAKSATNRALVLLGVQHLSTDKTDPSIASHAWVELDGRVVGEAENITEQFTQIAKN